MSDETNLPLRQRLGLTQQHFAEYLRISRSTLAMHESKGVMLPTAAVSKISKLELLLQQQNKQTKKVKPAAYEKPHADKAIKQLEKLANRTAMKLKRAARKLETVQEMYARDTRTHQLLQTLQAEDNKDRHDTLWLPMMQDITEKNIEKAGLPVQYKLKLTISSLQHLAAAIQRQLDELKKI